MQIQPADQKIVAAGNNRSAGGTLMAVQRYDAMGSVDAAHGSSGLMTIAAPTAAPNGLTESWAWGLTVQPDGKALVAGQFTSSSTTDIAVARLTATLDTTFGGVGYKLGTGPL
ncbi:MAG TPA: delta-60 repeat domain-containing protein, partial [Pirellulaceae bacterium]|nr:delta-60 repeat domain-containing protein [Pirellulaceae bacterium]